MLTQVVQLEVTTRCNRECPFCLRKYMIKLRGIGDLELKDVDKVINELNPKVMTLHGWGEPLLHPNLGDIISRVKSYGIYTSLSTNGDYLIPSKLREIVIKGLDELVFGFYSRGHMDNLYRVLNDLKELKKKFLRPRVIIDITLIDSLEDDTRLIINEASKIDIVDIVIMHRLFDVYGISDYKRLNQKKEHELIKYARSVLRNKHLIPPPPHKLPCITAWMGVFITWRLEISPCCFLAIPKFFLGRIGSYDWIEKRKLFFKDIKSLEVCLKCPAP